MSTKSFHFLIFRFVKYIWARRARGHVEHVEHVGRVGTLGTPFSRLVGPNTWNSFAGNLKLLLVLILLSIILKELRNYKRKLFMCQPQK